MSRIRGLLCGLAVLAAASAVGPSDIIAASDGDRIIQLYNIHSKETASILFKKDGKYVASGLEKANWMLRDWRRNETTSMDPALIDLLWEIHTELGSREPIHIISGYRAPATNEMLRKTVGGQARHSRHILGKAADVEFPDVPLKKLRYSALIRERGGVGYYPTSAIPFVHIDTDRVRAWPRLPRYELALLFPQGHTQHMPADGGPLTRDDVRVAREHHKDLAVQIAEFRSWLAQPKAPVLVADAGAPERGSTGRQQIAALPSQDARLIEAPHLAIDPRLQPITAPTAQEQARLTELAALAALEPRLVSGPVRASRNRTLASMASLGGSPIISASLPGGQGRLSVTPRLASASIGSEELTSDAAAGRFGWANGWVRAPEFDDEHPDELSYRPFPIGPLLTASPNEPLLADLVHQDVARTVDMLDQPSSTLPLRFRPGEQTAELMWAQKFRGDPVGLAKLIEAQGGVLAPPSNVADRQVRVSGR